MYNYTCCVTVAEASGSGPTIPTYTMVRPLEDQLEV